MPRHRVDFRPSIVWVILPTDSLQLYPFFAKADLKVDFRRFPYFCHAQAFAPFYWLPFCCSARPGYHVIHGHRRPSTHRPCSRSYTRRYRARETLVDAHRYWVRPGMLAVARVAPADADLAANYLAHRFGKGSARVTVAGHSATIRLSLPIASIPLTAMKGYLNLEATLIETYDLPRLQSLRIGKLSFPDGLTDMLAFQLERWLRRSPEYRTMLDALRQVKISRSELSIVYRWTGGFPRFSREVRSSIIGELERERLFHYHSLLAAHARQNGATVSLAQILPFLMQEAAGRSADGESTAENRAIILALTFHVLGISLEQIFPEAASGRVPASEGHDRRTRRLRKTFYGVGHYCSLC